MESNSRRAEYTRRDILIKGDGPIPAGECPGDCEFFRDEPCGPNCEDAHLFRHTRAMRGHL